jgi:hypothetical protein
LAWSAKLSAKRLGVVGVEGLGLGAGAAAGGGVADVSEADVAAEVGHVVGAEDVADEAVVLAEVEAAALGGDDGYTRASGGGCCLEKSTWI